jgi:hypothetical protein
MESGKFFTLCTQAATLFNVSLASGCKISAQPSAVLGSSQIQRPVNWISGHVRRDESGKTLKITAFCPVKHQSPRTYEGESAVSEATHIPSVVSMTVS